MTTKDLIAIDTKYAACTAINTEEWLQRVLGDEHEIESEELENRLNTKWLMESEDEIKAYLEEMHGVEFNCTRVDNVYNNENDFSDVFQWQVFYPADGKDWMYADDVYVGIEIHQGGDVRGNYGRVRLYQTSDLADSCFFDWCLGWSVQYANSEPVPENDRFSVGYSSHPFYEMEKHLKDGERGMMWSEKRQCFVAWYQDGRAVEIHPDMYV